MRHSLIAILFAAFAVFSTSAAQRSDVPPCPPAPNSAADGVPTPAQDTIMLAAFRANYLCESGLTEDYANYRDPSKAGFPKQVGGNSDDRRKLIFDMAIAKLNMAIVGLPMPPAIQQAAKTTILKRLTRLSRAAIPAQLGVANQQWAGKIIGEDQIQLDPRSLDQASTAGQTAARALIRDYVSPEKAATYEQAPLLAQADMLLEVGEAIVRSRAWPTAYIVSLNDGGQYAAGRTYVAIGLGTDSPEYENWPSMTDRQRGEAVKKAILASFHVGRQFAQGKISREEWARLNHSDLARAPTKSTVLLAGGIELWNRYNRALEEEQEEIFAASVLKNQGWIWTLQAAL